MTTQTNGSSSLMRPGAINPTLLRQDKYFESLIKAAYDEGLLGDDEAQRIQMDCFYLLAEKTKKYTGGSSSFVADDGESIMKSNVYTISLHLKSLPTNMDAIEAVKAIPLGELYALGQKNIQTRLATCRYLYHEILKNMVDIDQLCYLSTLTESVRQFFERYTDYHAWYHAHELPKGVAFHYPICYPGYIGKQGVYAHSKLEDFVGIEYVQRYLQAVYYENLFCKCFDSEAIHRLLMDENTAYSSERFNIFEKVLSRAVGRIVAGAQGEGLCLSHGKIGAPEAVWAKKPLGKGDLDRLCRQLMAEIGLKNTQAQMYVSQAVKAGVVYSHGAPPG